MSKRRVPQKRTTYKKSGFYGTKKKDPFKRKPDIRLLSQGLIISVKEARKKLGKDAGNMDDETVMFLIFELTDLAQELLNNN